MGPDTPLGIIAGDGALPRKLAEARADAGLPYLVLPLPGVDAGWFADHPCHPIRFERMGAFFSDLRNAGVTHLVLAGGFHRPRLKLWTTDWGTIRLLPRVLRLFRRGDDGLLRGLEAILAEEGLTVIAPEEVLGAALTIAAGPLGRRIPSTRDMSDARRAAQIVAALGPLDVGQGAVVANGVCLAVEAVEGTDLMLDRVAALPTERRLTAPPPSGILWKAPKPGQDQRLDRPTVGPGTVDAAERAGLSGIVVAAGEVLCPERDAMRDAADRAGLFVYGARPEEVE